MFNAFLLPNTSYLLNYSFAQIDAFRLLIQYQHLKLQIHVRCTYPLTNL
jgi:hypothetical protein